MSTCAVADLRLSTAFKALFLTTPTVIYIQGYQLIPDSLIFKCIKLNQNNYLKLIKFIQATFKVDRQGRVIRMVDSHSANTGFYEAVGSYEQIQRKKVLS
ncbi:MAG: DUF2459 domain-containing protein [Aulosira sp. DedQUE10]|nr:DUF2459 domain-containing protein [Aulosira sp. DedQUE10]